MKRNIRDTIIDSLNSLLEQYPFEKITTRMIADKAESSTATFYRYFKDKQEVLCCNWDRMMAESIQKSHSFRDLFFYMTLGYRKFGFKLGTAIVKYTGDNNYTEYTFKKTMEFVDNIIRNERNDSGLTTDENFQCSILASGIAQIFPLLSLQCTDEQASHFADLLNNMVPAELRNIQF